MTGRQRGALKFGVICALAAEAQSLSDRKLNTKTVYETGENVLILVAGVGRDNAMRGCEQLVDAGANCLVSWGFAGALAPDLVRGVIVMPTNVRSETASIEVNASALAVRPGTHRGSLFSSDQAIRTVAEKRQLHAALAADAVDMESYAIAAFAQSRGVACRVIRAIVDTSKDDIPAFIDASGTTKGLLRGCLQDPAAIAAVARLGIGYFKARRNLAKVARAFTAGATCARW